MKIPRFKKILKELLFTVLLMGIILNIMSYIRAPQLDSKQLEIFDADTIQNTHFETNTTINKPILIHFWATWCPTCKLEAGNIERLSQHFNVITVAVKSGSDTEISDYLKTHDFSFDVINDHNGFLASKFKVAAFPTTFIYDSKGNLAFSEVGYTSTLGLYLRMWWAQ